MAWNYFEGETDSRNDYQFSCRTFKGTNVIQKYTVAFKVLSLPAEPSICNSTFHILSSAQHFVLRDSILKLQAREGRIIHSRAIPILQEEQSESFREFKEATVRKGFVYVTVLPVLPCPRLSNHKYMVTPFRYGPSVNNFAHLISSILTILSSFLPLNLKHFDKVYNLLKKVEMTTQWNTKYTFYTRFTN